LWAVDPSVWTDHLNAAELAATTALSLDPDNSSALVALGNVHRDRWDWDLAEDAYLRALEVDPDNVEAHQQYAEHLSMLGLAAEALQAARRALALERAPVRLNVAAYVARENLRYDESIALLEEGIAGDTEGRLVYLRHNLFITFLLSGRWERAWELVPDVVEPDQLAEARAIWPVSGPPPAEADFDDWPGMLRTKAVLLQLSGHSERTLSVLEEMTERRPPFGPQSFLWYPVFDPLRDDPRFQALADVSGVAGRVPIRTPAEAAQ
jgi:tetratricopeptide (TPR) repeat protein